MAGYLHSLGQSHVCYHPCESLSTTHSTPQALVDSYPLHVISLSVPPTAEEILQHCRLDVTINTSPLNNMTPTQLSSLLAWHMYDQLMKNGWMAVGSEKQRDGVVVNTQSATKTIREGMVIKGIVVSNNCELNCTLASY
jgi:hypothetical protein